MSRPLPSAVPHPSPQTNEISVFRSASSPIIMFFEASLMILTLVCGLLRNFLGCFEWHVVLAVSPVAHLTLTLCVRLIPESPWKAWACLASPFPVLFLCFCPSSYIIGPMIRLPNPSLGPRTPVLAKHPLCCVLPSCLYPRRQHQWAGSWPWSSIITGSPAGPVPFLWGPRISLLSVPEPSGHRDCLPQTKNLQQQDIYSCSQTTRGAKS